jgi:RNA polymerase sigma-70 factor (ECF subfamily)
MKTSAVEACDNDLAKDAAGGKVAAFKELVERYQKRAYLFARGMVHNSDDAYDLSQEAFVRVYKHLKNFNPTYPFKVWLFHILSNLCKNHLRQKKLHDKVVIPTDSDYEPDIPIDDNPDTLYGHSEIQEQVWKAINSLPHKFREIIILCHFQEMSYEEVSQVLEIPRGSVMSRLYYARLKLREIIEQMGLEL